MKKIISKYVPFLEPRRVKDTARQLLKRYPVLGMHAHGCRINQFFFSIYVYAYVCIYILWYRFEVIILITYIFLFYFKRKRWSCFLPRYTKKSPVTLKIPFSTRKPRFSYLRKKNNSIKKTGSSGWLTIERATYLSTRGPVLITNRIFYIVCVFIIESRYLHIMEVHVPYINILCVHVININWGTHMYICAYYNST